MRHRPLRTRLSWTLVFVAWFAQWCLPLAHAAMPATPHAATAAWCGDPSNAVEAAATLPAEIREALALDEIGADHLAHCAQLCAVGTTPAPLPAMASAGHLAPTQAEAPAFRPTLATGRQHALPPPSRGPPTQG